jgi:aqualysin 1
MGSYLHRTAALAAAILCVSFACTAQAAAPALFPVIVVFKDTSAFSLGATNTGLRGVLESVNQYLDRGVLQRVSAIESRFNFSSEHVYSSALRGFAAKLSAEQILTLQQDPQIAYVEADGIVHTMAQTLPWGIDRVDADISSTKAGDGSGAVNNVNVYVIDTGIDAAHPDLNVVQHVNFSGYFGGGNKDCNGHGTHVAGIIGARDNAREVVGVAPGAPLVGVKVLSCSGSGSISGVIKGIDWVTANAKKPAVANMSLGGAPSQALDDAVRRSVSAGIFYAVAGGNESQNACNVSPARAGAGINNGLMTVAATDQNNAEPDFSNYGVCIDAWAPGVSILSTRRGGGTTTYSGTSMASPHVAGGAALFLSKNPGSAVSAVESAIRLGMSATGQFSKDGRAVQLLSVGSF